MPSVAFALFARARLPLGPRFRGVQMTTLQASLDAADRTVARPLPGASLLRFDDRGLPRRREPRYRGPWRLPGPDLHRPAAMSLRSVSATPTTSSRLFASELLDARKRVANIQNVTGRYRAARDGMKVRPDLDSAVPDTTRSHWATRSSPNFKTGVRARALRPVRFPSASAREESRSCWRGRSGSCHIISATLVSARFLVEGSLRALGSTANPFEILNVDPATTRGGRSSRRHPPRTPEDRLEKKVSPERLVLRHAGIRFWSLDRSGRKKQ